MLLLLLLLAMLLATLRLGLCAANRLFPPFPHQVRAEADSDADVTRRQLAAAEDSARQARAKVDDLERKARAMDDEVDRARSELAAVQAAAAGDRRRLEAEVARLLSSAQDQAAAAGPSGSAADADALLALARRDRDDAREDVAQLQRTVDDLQVIREGPAGWNVFCVFISRELFHNSVVSKQSALFPLLTL